MPCGNAPRRPTASWNAAAAARRQFTSRSKHAATRSAGPSAGACGASASGAYARANAQQTYAAASRTCAPTECGPRRTSYVKASATCGTASGSLSGSKRPRLANSASAKHAPCRVFSFSPGAKHSRIDPTTSSPNSAGSRAVIRPRPFAADHRTTVSLSRSATSKDSITSSTPSGTSSSSSDASSVETAPATDSLGVGVREPVAAPPVSSPPFFFRLSTSERAPRSYRHATTLGFRNSKPILCASLQASCRTSALPFAAGDSARSRASPQARSATPSSAPRVPSLKMAASARATPGTRNVAFCSAAANALARSDEDILPSRVVSVSVSVSVSSAARGAFAFANASVAQSRKLASARGMSGRVSRRASSVAARSRTIPGSERYRSWHRRRIRITTGGASASSASPASESTVTRSNGINTKMESQRMSTARVSHAVPSSSFSSSVVAHTCASCDRTSSATTGSRSRASCGKNFTTVLAPRTVASAFRAFAVRCTRTMSASSPLCASARSTPARGVIQPSRCGSRSCGSSW